MGNFIAQTATQTSAFRDNDWSGMMGRQDGTWQWMNNMMGGNMAWGFGLWGFTNFLFWVLILVTIVLFMRWLWNAGQGSSLQKTPLDILKERYAKGEIDKKEFEERKKDLT